MRHPGSKVLLGAAAVVFSIPSAGLAQSKDLLIGTWKLVSAVHITEKGEIKDS